MLYTRPLSNSQAQLRMVKHNVCHPLTGLARVEESREQLPAASQAAR
jgi:hypothetical protein